MLISDYGKVVTIPRHNTIFISVVSIIAFLLFTTVASFSVYLKSHREKENLKKTLDRFEKTVKNLEAEKEILTARLVLAGIDPELLIKAKTDEHAAETKSGQAGKSNAGKDSSSENAIESGEIAASGKEESDVDSYLSSDVASVENFEADYDERLANWRLRFKLDNLSDEKLSGYILILLKNPGKQSDSWMFLPDCPVENGGPSDYKNGRRFEISRFKTIRFTAGKVEDKDRFVEAEVYVYNQDGNLLLRKIFSLNSRRSGEET